MLWSIVRLVATLLAGSYGFLPKEIKAHSWVTSIALISFIIAMTSAGVELWQRFTPRSTAYIAKDGTILKRKNFPWKVELSRETPDPTYQIWERYGEPTDVTVIPDSYVPTKVYMAMTGVAIQFGCSKDAVPNFKVEIRN